MKLKEVLFSAFALMASVCVNAQVTFTVDGITYVTYYEERFYSKGVYVTAKADGSLYEGSVTLPFIVKYEEQEYRVAGIGDNAFKGCTGLTDITIEGVMDFIGNSAFEGCTGLKEFTIPSYYSDNIYEGYVRLGYRAFWGCHLTSLISRIGNPPSLGYDNPSHHSSSIPWTADWIGSDGGDFWFYNNHTTLYVPVGCIEAYSATSDGWYKWEWGDFFTDIKEWGVEESDPVPDFYERIKNYKSLCAQLEDSIITYTDYAFRYLVATLYEMAAANGETPDEEQIVPQIHDYFAWKHVERDYDGGDYDIPFIPSHLNILNAILTDLTTAEEELKNQQESRKAYYTAKAKASPNTEQLKGEWESKASDVNELLNRVGASLEALYSSNILEEKYNEFMDSIKAAITPVSDMVAEKTVVPIWHSLGGHRFMKKPMQPGIYIINGRKVVVR